MDDDRARHGFMPFCPLVSSRQWECRFCGNEGIACHSQASFSCAWFALSCSLVWAISIVFISPTPPTAGSQGRRQPMDRHHRDSSGFYCHYCSERWEDRVLLSLLPAILTALERRWVFNVLFLPNRNVKLSLNKYLRQSCRVFHLLYKYLYTTD